MISASLSPNTEADDIILVLKALFSPWRWRSGESLNRVERWFRAYFPDHEVALFNSGRSAFLVILKAFGIGKGDEVIIQAFTCVAVPNSVIWAGAKPIFADIDETLNLDPVEAEKKITLKTKAIVIQHTFGMPAKIDKFAALARKYHLILIEDCAHALGATYKSQKVGTSGDAAFFSFGRDKVISSVFGGAAIINVKCQMSNVKLKQYEKELSFPSYFWIFQQLLHPIAFSVILLLYDVIIGKVMLVVLQKLKLLSFPVYSEEKLGVRPADFPARYPNALAKLLVNQLKKIERYNQNRREVADWYRKSLKGKAWFKLYPGDRGGIYLRFPLLVADPKDLLKRAKEKGILLGNWYHHVIDPRGVNFDKIGYKTGACPRAEKAAKSIINLPTRITLSQAKRITGFLL